ncbi:DUF6868 family protein [Stenotrophomonas sp. YIM B06876]|uniref:DUF6868 family protein n=1 Tax=Stenotrophomonas sp. YIM B06876 TaxID=3060211 RepID=UPI0027391C83|nr:hypothetical protein [Stenotrophomonas sp. YIM B06876]
MTFEFLYRVLLWSLAINYAVLFAWFAVFIIARDWMRRWHGKWFHLADTTFDAIHYSGMAFYKICILLLNLAPLIALCLAGGGR